MYNLPPKIQHNLSSNSSFVSNEDSLGKYWAKPSDPFERGMMVSFNTIFIFAYKYKKSKLYLRGYPPSKNQDTMACPHSW